MTFMELTTQITGLVEKKKEIIAKTANMLSKAVLERANMNKTNSLENDIKKSLEGFSNEEKIDILTKTIVNVSKQNKYKDKNDEEDSFNGIFHSRGY
jgi:hypothetical protein